VPNDPRTLNTPESNAMTSYLVSLLQHRYRTYQTQKQWDLELLAAGTRDVDGDDAIDSDAGQPSRHASTELSRAQQAGTRSPAGAANSAVAAASGGVMSVTRFLSGAKPGQVFPSRTHS